MTDKTLGQIAQAAYVEAYKAFCPSDAMNLLTSSENSKCWDAAAAAVIEECAKIADAHADDAFRWSNKMPDVESAGGWLFACDKIREVAFALRRSLKSPSSGFYVEGSSDGKRPSCNSHERIHEDGSGYICRYCGIDMDDED